MENVKQETKAITEFSDVELKAMAYDLIAQVEFCQGQLRTINQELARRQSNAQPQGTKEGSNNTSEDEGISGGTSAESRTNLENVASS